MSDPAATDMQPEPVRELQLEPPPVELAPVHAEEEKQQQQGKWTRWLIWFLRAMAVLSMLKVLYHWSVVLGIGEGPDSRFSTESIPWQTATVYFAIIDLVAWINSIQQAVNG